MGALLNEFMRELAEIDFETSGARDTMEEIVGYAKYCGIHMSSSFDEDKNIATTYLKVPKESELLEEYEGVCRPMCGEVAAKIMKQLLVGYFNKFKIITITPVVKYKIEDKKWTLSDADKAKEDYEIAKKQYHEKMKAKKSG